ncbi:hypothetical protein MN1_400 [Thermus phage MN1]|nr:hypothetical protein MN1_400 [Thermus phage MN1]
MPRRSRSKLLKRVFRREPALWEPLRRGGPHRDRRRKKGKKRDWEKEADWGFDKTDW